MATFALAETPKTTFSVAMSDPILMIPDPSQGQEGRNLRQWVERIFLRWQEQPLRGLSPAPKLWIEPDPTQIAANQPAIDLLRAWRVEGDVLEQSEALAILQSYTDSLYAGFQAMEPVQSVYIQPLPEATNVFVFLSQNRYDDALMDDLLDKEADILDRHPETLFNFHYVPLLSAAPTVPQNAALIFSR